MPIYEEKLISPLAIRFTQNHIKTVFRDGRPLEATVQEIVEEPGTDGYDVILRFPFPAIEIVRWHAERHKDGGEVTSLGEIATGDHWFTLDNRRLYCLQRVAAACWPRRVGVAVQLLYASRGSIRNKCDTSTNGLSVTISNHQRDSPICVWNWRQEASFRKKDKHTRMAIQAILIDDAKPTVDDLPSVLGDTCSAIERAMKSMAVELPMQNVRPPAISQEGRHLSDCLRQYDLPQTSEGRQTPTTAEPSDDSEASADSPRMHNHEKYDQQIEDFAWWAIEEINQQLDRPDSKGFIWINNWNEVYAPYLGSLKQFLASHPDKFAIIQRGRTFRVEKVKSKSSHCHNLHPKKIKQQWY
jgi:hypothetical protein